MGKFSDDLSEETESVGFKSALRIIFSIAIILVVIAFAVVVCAGGIAWKLFLGGLP